MARPATGNTPRINIAVSPGTKDVLERLAAVMGTSMSRVAGEIIDEAFPQLLAMTEALEKAKSDPNASAVDLQVAMLQAQRKSLDAHSEMLKPSDK